jgi:hypothetical protein
MAMGNKPKKLRSLFLNFGKLVLDITKLSFGSLVLGTIIRGDFSQSVLLWAGIIISAVGALAGIIIVTLCEEK